jgi:hypothetical protein
MKKPKKPAAKTAKKNAKAIPAPEWLLDTPEILYQLMAEDHQSGDWKQSIELTYAEFDALKDHLAKMRGIKVPAKELTNAD